MFREKFAMSVVDHQMDEDNYINIFKAVFD
jgi:hypothetical protein